LDDKVIASWNGLMISGLAHAGRMFDRSDWISESHRALISIQNRMVVDGKLHSIYAGGRAQFHAYLDDYAFLLAACIECLQARWDSSILAFAEYLAHAILNDFEDTHAGGYFFTAHDHEALITRPRIVHDAATPSGYASAARSLMILGHLTGEMRFIHSAEKALASAIPQARDRPAAFASFILALETALIGPRIIVLRGESLEMAAWALELTRANLPHTLIISIPHMYADPLPPMLDKPRPTISKVNAWVCQGVSCLPELTDLPAVLKVCNL
jgi:uncharacterized protein YyaL (SSP411 family)